MNSADGNPVAQAQVLRYRLGDRELLAVVKKDVGVEAIAGRDGVMVCTDTTLGRLAKEAITIRPPGSMRQR